MQIKSYGLRLIIGIVGPGVTILILQKITNFDSYLYWFIYGIMIGMGIMYIRERTNWPVGKYMYEHYEAIMIIISITGCIKKYDNQDKSDNNYSD